MGIICVCIKLVLIMVSMTQFLMLASEAAAAPRKLAVVNSPPLALPYHNGALLTGPSPLHLYFLWYGSFSPAQKQILSDFASSLSPSSSSIPSPSVSSWWSTVASYTDSSHSHVSSSITLAAQASVPASSPSVLSKEAIASLLLRALQRGELPLDDRGVYFVLTGEDVAVEGMCMSVCGSHDHLQLNSTRPTTSSISNVQANKNGDTLVQANENANIHVQANSNEDIHVQANSNEDIHVQVKIGGKEKPSTPSVVFAWVGNSALQCPGTCAWPFALPEYGPLRAVPLVAPNGDVGMDGMVINVATLLAGAATNPLGAGYFQGLPTEPLEAASACAGIFASDAYPGFPGTLLTNPRSGASFNVHGANGRTFLLPSIWNPISQKCSPPS